LVTGLPTVKMLAAGGAHALALTTRGQVFGWGDDNTGQVGVPGAACVDENPKTCVSPQLIDGVTASAIAGGYVHSLIATVQEHVVGLGRDAEGELGDGYSHPATQVGPAGDRNALDTPDGGEGGSRYTLTVATGVAQIRPQAPVNASYTYTGDGLRATAKTTFNDTTTVIPTTVSQTDSWDTLAGLPALLSDGTHDYLTAPDGTVIEQTDVLNRATGGGTVFLHGDRLGSTRLVTTAGGVPAGEFSYTPTGVRIQDDGLALLPYGQGIPPLQTNTTVGFAGSITDPGTGFLYLRARYNDPATDQFLTRDPVVGVTGRPYNYANGDPVKVTDPSGLCGWVDNSPCLGGGVWANILTSDIGSGALDVASFANDWANPMKAAVDGYRAEIQAINCGATFWQAVKIGSTGAAISTVEVALQALGAKIGDAAAKKLLERLAAKRAAEDVPTVVFSRSRAPGIAQNFDDAVADGAPTRLNRVGSAARDANRRAALRGQDPAPAGQSLDEYPFACSAQGGCGATVGAVPAGEQSYQGGVLSQFFQRNGIGVGDPFNVMFGP
jgi:RHS repeat-associated protein